MKRLFGVAAMALLCVTLGACSLSDISTAFKTTVTDPLNNKTVALIGTGLGVANDAVLTYSALPVCPIGTSFKPDNWCHDRTVLIALDADQNLAVAAYGDLVTLQDTVGAGGVVVGSGFSAKLAVAQQSLDILNGLIKAYAIGAVS